MTISGSYLVKDDDSARDRGDWVVESSRRPRGVPIYAAIRSLGREGLAAMIERCCEHASHMAQRLGAVPGVEILNDVVINQVMARFGDDDAATRAVIAAAQADGTCWMGETTWHGKVAMRLSVSNWSTTSDDIDRSVDAILAGWEELP
jgi:glutamate/tyrosine decarboxylase-like PLP-dependent enzyme